jgi:ABC-type branched-subunit amino acid transport system ATPase component
VAAFATGFGNLMTGPVMAIAQAQGVPIAQLQNVTQRYKRAVALDDVTVALPSGCMVGLIGPDGVGKSTLLSMLAGARSVQSGRVIVLGGDMAVPATATRFVRMSLSCRRGSARIFIPI